MNYFRIEDSFESVGRWYLKAPKMSNGVELDPRFFVEGKEYRGQTTYPSTVKADAFFDGKKDYGGEPFLEIPIRRGTKPLDFTLGPFDVPVVVERVAACLEACLTDPVQWISTTVTGCGLRFRVLNVLNVIDAIDEQHSEITRWTEEDRHPLAERVGTYAGIGRLVLKKEMVAGATILRLKNWELPLVVSETVKEVLENQHTTGIKFKELAVV